MSKREPQMLLHEDPELFRAAINFTAHTTSFQTRLIEKDYFCSILLQYLAAASESLVFKGGTCLAKVHAEFYRLSEDLDFAISMPVDATRNQRREWAAALKGVIAGLPRKIPHFQVEQPLTGANSSAQYIAVIGYTSVVTGQPNNVKVETRLAAWFVRQMGLPYEVEKKLREQKAGPSLRQAMRAWQMQPVLNRLHRAMELTRRKTLPQGLLGQAIDYALKRWTALSQFITDGTLKIDNNLIENSIRPSALGKKNWLFVGHPEAGERSAVIYTLLGSCRRHGINPFDYLKDLFTRLPAAKITHIQEFTPAEWVKAKAKHQAVALAA